MCNANHHRPNCNCGFGEVGGIKFAFTSQHQLPFSSVETIPYSYIVSHTPNSKCPVCSEPVFFYKNKHGSAVFFDELGPPWPKHPCTNNSLSIPFTTNEFKSKPSTAYSYGWFCAKLINASKIKGEIYEFQFKLEDDIELNLFISAVEVEKRANLQVISNEAICYLRLEVEGVYSISLLSDDLKVLDGKGFTNKCHL